jgi:diadenylate cyclase
MSKRRIGALIVLERQTRLGEIIKTGTVIDAAPSSEMIGNIFFPNSPLHDGAMIIRAGRLHAAGCYLPLSENYTISREMGTRHRAGLGISENSDAVVVIVSEETGIITIAENGKLRRGFTGEQLVRELQKYFVNEKEEKGERRPSFLNKVRRNNDE